MGEQVPTEQELRDWEYKYSLLRDHELMCLLAAIRCLRAELFEAESKLEVIYQCSYLQDTIVHGTDTCADPATGLDYAAMAQEQMD